MVYIYICLCYFCWWVGCVPIHNHDWLQCIVHWGCDGFVPREQSLLPRESTARTSCAGLLEPDRTEDLENIYIYPNIHEYLWISMDIHDDYQIVHDYHRWLPFEPPNSSRVHYAGMDIHCVKWSPSRAVPAGLFGIWGTNPVKQVSCPATSRTKTRVLPSV
jgi:hypothetical protein